MAKKKNKKSSAAAALGFENRKDSTYRDYAATAVVGDKAQGKSTFTKLYAMEYKIVTNRLFEEGRINHRKKILIHDPTGKNGAYDCFEEISFDELRNGTIIIKDGKKMRRRWSHGIRVLRTSSKADLEEMIRWVTDHFTQGLFYADEASDWMKKESPDGWQKALVKKHRMNELDVACNFHLFMDIPRDLRPLFWNYILFRTVEKPTNTNWFATRQFPNPDVMYEKYRATERTPHDHSKILQHYEVFTKTFDAVAK